MELILAFAVSALTQLIKKYALHEKLNGLGVHAIILGVAVLVAVVRFGWQFVPAEYISYAVQIWAYSVLAYEFLFKTIYKEIIVDQDFTQKKK